MSRIRANQITNQSADGAPTVQHGLIIAGVSTFTGSVSIGGTLTYEDVTNIDSIGIVTARGGIHIDDSIVHIGDTNTKIRFPAVDTFSVETGGSERLRIGSNGSVGIGTDYLSGNNSVYHKLMVEGDTTSQIGVVKIVRKHSSASNSTYTLEVDSSSHTSNVTNAGAMSVNVNSGRAFTINGNGHLSVGGSNVTDVNLLTLNGTGAGQNVGMVFNKTNSPAKAYGINVHNGTGDLLFYDYTTNAERLRIASNGDIGLGTVPETDSYQPSLYFAGGNANIWGSGNANLYTAVNARYTGAGGWKYNNNGVASYVGQQSGVWNFFNAPSGTADATATFTERFRITSDGRIQANTQSAYSNEKFLFYFSGTHDNQDCFTIQNHNSYENTALIIKHGRGGLSGYSGKSISFRGNDNSEEGSIVIGTSSVAFNTSSDYRLKENAVPISDGISRLKTLKPYRFNFKKDPGTTVDGFFAHEVTAVPEAVSGEKDARKKIYYEEGDTLPSGKNLGDFKEFSSTEISPQSMDHSKLVPLLTAALQEAITKIETLEQDNIDLRARVTNLEGN